MSRGIAGVYKLLTMENSKVIYAYSGYNFSFPYDKNLAQAYDGRIEISLVAFEEFNWDENGCALKGENYEIAIAPN